MVEGNCIIIIIIIINIDLRDNNIGEDPMNYIVDQLKRNEQLPYDCFCCCCCCCCLNVLVSIGHFI